LCRKGYAVDVCDEANDSDFSKGLLVGRPRVFYLLRVAAGEMLAARHASRFIDKRG
jgi:hypothetical protein